MEPARRFSARVENYSRYRPGYPARVLDLLRERYGLMRGVEIAEVGSGTGALTRVFLENGNRVVGVEPNEEMRLAGERLLAEFPRFSSLAATAGRTTLAGLSGIRFWSFFVATALGMLPGTFAFVYFGGSTIGPGAWAVLSGLALRAVAACHYQRPFFGLRRRVR